MTEQDGPKGRLRRVTALAGRLVALLAARNAIGQRRRSRGADWPPADGDGDPRQREVPADRRAETAVAALLALAGLFGFGFLAVYVLDGYNTQFLGLAIGGALALLSAAFVTAGKLVVPQETHVEERDLLFEERESEQVVDLIESGAEGVSRRKLLAGAAGLAGAGMLTALATPLASLGPNLRGVHETPWRRGVRLVDEDGKPYSASDIVIGSLFTALPEHADPEVLGAALIVVRLPARYLRLPPARRTWAPEGIVAYSKICTHAACAISLYRYPTYQPTSDGPAFTCPCHYSTFLPGEGGRVAFGPAGRALPQLPLAIDAQGHLRAAAPFGEDVGPSWFSVRRSQS
jgi:ubiquinol-cytochrome c reductase iron-sulfur subunit